MSSRETRHTTLGEVRFDDGDASDRRFSAVVLRYGVVDTYDTTFVPGVFTKSLSERLPRIMWGHDWLDPIGRWVGYEDTDDGLILHGELDDFDAVPRARQAAAQLRSGTIDQFSVGFERIADRKAGEDFPEHVIAITEGRLIEASLVAEGSVPGTHTLSTPRSALALAVRAPGEQDDGTVPAVPLDVVTDIVLKMRDGELDIADGLSALKSAAISSGLDAALADLNRDDTTNDADAPEDVASDDVTGAADDDDTNVDDADATQEGASGDVHDDPDDVDDVKDAGIASDGPSDDVTDEHDVGDTSTHDDENDRENATEGDSGESTDDAVDTGPELSDDDMALLAEATAIATEV